MINVFIWHVNNMIITLTPQQDFSHLLTFDGFLYFLFVVKLYFFHRTFNNKTLKSYFLFYQLVLIFVSFGV